MLAVFDEERPDTWVPDTRFLLMLLLIAERSLAMMTTIELIKKKKRESKKAKWHKLLESYRKTCHRQMLVLG